MIIIAISCEIPIFWGYQGSIDLRWSRPTCSQLISNKRQSFFLFLHLFQWVINSLLDDKNPQLVVLLTLWIHYSLQFYEENSEIADKATQGTLQARCTNITSNFRNKQIQTRRMAIATYDNIL